MAIPYWMWPKKPAGPEYSPTVVYEACIAACDWLEANPDMHGKGTYAKGPDGYECGIYDPDVVSFCMLGRVAFEGKLEDSGRVRGFLKTIGVDDGALWQLNDGDFGIPFMRRVFTARYHETMEGKSRRLDS